MKEDTAAPRKEGRPRLDESCLSVPVTVRLPTKQFDDLYQTARNNRQTVSDVIRKRLQPPTDE